MDNDERKPRLHIHTGGLIILVIIILILFRVDIKSKIKSPQFQKNITYIEETVKNFWYKYILNPLQTKGGKMFKDITNKEVEKLQNNFNKNVFKIPSDKDIEDASN